MENTCENIQEQILELITGTLSAEKAAELQRHISQCPSCGEYLRALQADDKLLGDFVEAMKPAVTRLENNVINALNREIPKREAKSILIWRKIIKSRITKLAAAAVIIVAVLIGIHQFGGSIDGTSVAFAQMTEAIMNVPCVHVVIEGHRGGVEHSREHWLGFESGIMCEKHQDGRVHFVNLKRNEGCIYSPDSGKIIVYQSFSDKESLDEINSAEKLLQQMLKELGILGAEMTVEQGQYEGKDVDIYAAELPETDYSPTVKMTGKGELVADHHTHLPLYGKVEGYGPDGAVLLEGKVAFDYPQSSPKDIYDLGVPESADVIDNTPAPEVEEVLAAYRACRDNAPKGHSVAVVREITLPTGKTHRKIKVVKEADEVQTEMQWHGWDSTLRGDDPHVTELKIVEDEYSRENNLICIQLLRDGYKRPPMVSRLPFKGLFYINPNRDYICEKSEILALRDAPWQGGAPWMEENTEQECSSVSEVVQYGRTASGQWYPKVKKAQTTVWNEDGTAEEYNYRTTIYLDTEAESFEETSGPDLR